MLRNSQRLARNTQFEQRIEAIRQVFDLPAATVELASVPEQIVSDISYLMPVAFLGAGHLASQAVARVCVQRVFDGVPRMNGNKPSLALGTGWLLAPRLLITNRHVVAARFAGEAACKRGDDIVLQAQRSQAWFDYVDTMKPYAVHNVVALKLWITGSITLCSALRRTQTTATGRWVIGATCGWRPKEFQFTRRCAAEHHSASVRRREKVSLSVATIVWARAMGRSSNT